MTGCDSRQPHHFSNEEGRMKKDEGRMQKLTQRLVDDVQALPDFFILPSAFPWEVIRLPACKSGVVKPAGSRRPERYQHFPPFLDP
jgi:hypothetical protein